MTAFPPYGGSYSSGHPWYYRLGGKILTPAEIIAEASTGDPASHHVERFAKLDKMEEPRRSAEISKARSEISKGMQRDVEIYGKCAAEINRLRTFIGPDPEPTFSQSLNEPNCSMSLKHNHIHYCASQLYALESLNRQKDLFDF